MKNLVASLGILAVLAGCGGVAVYPDTDVAEPPGFDLKTAKADKSDGAMRTGILEYEGQGDLLLVFRAHQDGMVSQGWSSVSDNFDATKAVGILQKDNRTCTVEMISTSGPIRVTITVEPGR